MKSSKKRNLLAKIEELLSTRNHLLTNEIAKELDIPLYTVYYLIRNEDLIAVKTGTNKGSVKVIGTNVHVDLNFEKACERVSLLWDYHNKHGKLLKKNVYDLCEQSHTNIYKTFNVNNLEGPPVWDSKPEIIRRKANALNDLAAELNQDFLTEDQAMQCLFVRKGRLHDMLDTIRKCHDIPRIDDSFSCDPIFRIDNSYYPSGLQVLDTRPGPDNTTIYRIR